MSYFCTKSLSCRGILLESSRFTVVPMRWFWYLMRKKAGLFFCVEETKNLAWECAFRVKPFNFCIYMWCTCFPLRDRIWDELWENRQFPFLEQCWLAILHSWSSCLHWWRIAPDKALFFFNSKVLIIFSYFSTKTFVVTGTQKKRLYEALLMSTHNSCFYGEIGKLLCGYPFLSESIVTCLKKQTKWQTVQTVINLLLDLGLLLG